ncbi:outer membrane lipoprotein carrier protein LolA [Marinilabiliaceae bacterium ANBcel2]|nr:outer membrane lipoprotein carrier protein LolA [Marinilabiliaceae bacterium ANBcel2]
MIKTFIALLFITTITINTHSQSPDVTKARDILDKVSAQTQKYGTIRADFTFTLENLQAEMTDTYEGSIVMKGEKFMVDVMGANTYFDGETVWTYMTEINEVNISDKEMLEEEGGLNPGTVFTIYEEGFNYIYDGEGIIRGRTVDIVDLFPEERDQPYSRIKLYIYRDDLQFAQIKQIGKDGTNYIIEVEDMVVDGDDVDDSYFTFNPDDYPDIVVIDLR